MPDKQDTIKLEMPRKQAVILADIIRTLAQGIEQLPNVQYVDEYFPNKWKGIRYTTFADVKLLYNKDDNDTIRHIDDHLKAGIFFAYYFKRASSAVLTHYSEPQLPNSLSNRMYGHLDPQSIEEKYEDIMLFPRELIGMELSKPPRYEIDQTIIDLYTETSKSLKSGKKNLLAHLFYCQGMQLTEIADTLSWSVDNENNIRRNISCGRILAEENNLPQIYRYSK